MHVWLLETRKNGASLSYSDQASVEYVALSPKPAYYAVLTPAKHDEVFAEIKEAVRRDPSLMERVADLLFQPISMPYPDADPNPSNPSPESTPVQKRINDVLTDIAGGHVSRPDLKRLGDAVGAATAPETGRKAQDQALGRAIGRNP